MNLRRKLLAFLQSQKKDAEYTELEYLESTGTQWIDTGIPFSPIKAVINLCFVESNTRELMGFGSYRTTYFGKTTAGLFELGGSYVLQGSNAYEWQEVTFTHNGLVTGGSGHLITKFGEITRTDNITDNMQGSSFYLFNTYNYGTTVACRVKISSAKFYNPDTNKLIMDLIPVLDKDFTPCMYDKVSGKFLYNQGDGEFKWKLPNQLEYLESDGNQYIDSGIECTSDLKVNFKGTCTTDVNLACCGGINTTNTPTLFRHHWSPRTEASGAIRFNYWCQYNTSNSPSFLAPWIKGGENEATIDPINGQAIVNGTKYTFTPLEEGLTTGRSYGIFARIANTGAIQSRPCRFNYFKIYKKDVLVCYLIPAFDENLNICMYDLVSKTYLYNQGSGTFKGYFEDGSQLVSYLESFDEQYIDTLLPVTENTGAFIDAEWSFENKPFSTLSGCYQSFMALAIVPSSRRICYSYNSNPTGTTSYPLKDGTFVPSNETSGVDSSKFITENGRFKVGLNYLESGKWKYETANENYETDLGGAVVQNNNTITLFGRRYSSAPQESNSYLWKGKIYSAKFTEGDKIVRHLIPVVKLDDTACMYDLVSKKYFKNNGKGEFGHNFKKTINATVVGSPTIKGAEVSGFSKSNYLTTPLPESLVIPADGDIELVACFKLEGSDDRKEIMVDDSEYFHMLALSGRKLYLMIRNANSYLLEKYFTYTAGTKYWVKWVSSNSTGETFSYSTDGITYTPFYQGSKYSSGMKYGPIYLGCYPFITEWMRNGTIYMDECYIKVAGQTVWKGYGNF